MAANTLGLSLKDFLSQAIGKTIKVNKVGRIGIVHVSGLI